MYTPLKDHPGHAQQLCRLLQLGEVQGKPTRLSGGFHHLVWRLQTSRGVYVVKQLAPDVDLADPGTAAHFNATERVAQSFASHGVGAIHALPHGEDYLHVLGSNAYLVYPWTDAVALEEGIVSARHALTVARLLARMHSAAIDAPVLAAEEQHPVAAADIGELVEGAKAHGVSTIQSLVEITPRLRAICDERSAAATVLKQRQVVSHGDLDQKNVLWNDEGEPVLIDWEAARLINPTREMLEEALDWSGFLTSFDEQVFGRFVREYQLAGGRMERGEAEAALCVIRGAWVDWLAYNIGRVINIDDEQQREIGNRQIALALSSIARLEELGARLWAILKTEKLPSA